MSETTHTNRRNLARTAGLFIVGAAGALTLTGGFVGSASALTPVPQPDLPIAQPPAKPQPPIVPGVIALPETPEPPAPQPPAPQPNLPTGPDQIALPLPTPDPHPAPHPQGPDVIVDGDGDGGGGGGFEGPDDFTAPETPETTVPETTVPDTTVPEVLDETVEADDGAGTPDVVETAAAPGSLAFTGSDLGLAGAGAALLAAGGVAAVIARRRQRDAGDTARA